jgi:hypothetical protein
MGDVILSAFAFVSRDGHRSAWNFPIVDIPPNKALLIGKLDQQNCKGIALLLPEGGELCVLMFSRHLPDLLQDLIVILGQLNGVEAPVMRVCSPIHQAPFL